eukprot:c26858_g1_i10 orf=199-789(-)
MKSSHLCATNILVPLQLPNAGPQKVLQPWLNSYPHLQVRGSSNVHSCNSTKSNWQPIRWGVNISLRRWLLGVPLLCLPRPRMFHIRKDIDIHISEKDSSTTALVVLAHRCHDVPHPWVHAIGSQWFSFIHCDSLAFKVEIAPARTFGIFEQIEQLRNAGFIKGGSLDNALVCRQAMHYIRCLVKLCWTVSRSLNVK